MLDMKDFIKFINEEHNFSPYSYPQLDEESMQLQDDMRTMYAMALQENLFIPKQYAGGGLGVSQLGKPAIMTAYDYHKGRPENDSVSFAQKRKWLGGHVFELWVYFLLKQHGYDVEHQAEVSINEIVPQGHPDFVVTSPSDVFIVECKHVSDSQFKQYKKEGMYNEQYITQLALYCKALNCPGMWAIGNTDTGEVMAIPYGPLEQKANQLYVDRALQIASVVTACSSFRECLQYISLPNHRTTKDGRHYPPPVMYISKGVLHPTAHLWKLSMNDLGQYSIEGYNYPDDCKQFEPNWEG